MGANLPPKSKNARRLKCCKQRPETLPESAASELLGYEEAEPPSPQVGRFQGPWVSTTSVGQTLSRREFRALYMGFQGRKEDSLCHSSLNGESGVRGLDLGARAAGSPSSHTTVLFSSCSPKPRPGTRPLKCYIMKGRGPKISTSYMLPRTSAVKRDYKQL